MFETKLKLINTPNIYSLSAFFKIPIVLYQLWNN